MGQRWASGGPVLGQQWASGGPAVAQRWPSGALAVPPLPVSLGLPQSVPKTKQPMSEFLFNKQLMYEVLFKNDVN